MRFSTARIFMIFTPYSLMRRAISGVKIKKIVKKYLGLNLGLHQFLACIVSISVKIPNLKRAFKTYWSCASGTYAHDEHAHQKLNDA